MRGANVILQEMDNELMPAVGVEKQGFIHISIPVGMLQCNCSIIGDPVTREALVVDPGDEVGRILDLIGRHKLSVKAIVSTHAHIDHVGGLSKLHKYTGAPVMMHREDLPLYQAMEMQAAFLGVAPPDLTDVHQMLADGDALQWGSLEAQVIHTPGTRREAFRCLCRRRPGRLRWQHRSFLREIRFLPEVLAARICGAGRWKRSWRR